MNIAILIPELGGGGAERVAQTLGDYYVERGNNVYYFIAGTDTKQDYSVKGKIIQTNITSCMKGELSDAGRLLKLFVNSLEMRKLKAQYKVDVAISFMEEFNYINILSKGKEKVVTRVCNTLSVLEKLYPDNLLYKKNIIRFFYSKAGTVIVLSQMALKEMRFYYGIPVKKIIRIPNMASQRAAIGQKGESWNYGSKVVICVGRLHFQKQYERILRAFSYVCMSEHNARLIILGKGPQLHYLKRICEKLKISDFVIFVGFTDNVTYYLEHARVFAMASKVEGFPNSMIEAMSCGVPVVTTDSPGACGEIIGKSKSIDCVNSMMFCKYGILTPNMPDEKLRINSHLSEQEIILGEVMLKVLTDDDIYKNYQSQSFKRAEMFSFDKVIKKWNQVIGI